MTVHEYTEGPLPLVVAAAARALVFLTVPWSVPERHARLAFRAAAEQLASEHAHLGIEFFALDEDATWCQSWLAGLGVRQLGTGYPLGAGSMLWLESGRAVSSEIGGCSLRAGDIVARSVSLWCGPL
jgi:hypothetical protein